MRSRLRATVPGVLAGLVAVLGPGPAVRAVTDAEICARGTGIPREDVLVCTRALILSTLPPESIATLHNARGRALRIIGEPAEARIAHDSALAANPLSAEAYLGRAQARLDLGRRAAAQQDLGEALALSPFLAPAWRALGRTRFLDGDDAGATSALDRALELDPGDGEALAFRGLVHFRRSRFREALSDFRAARGRQLAYPYLPLWDWLSARRAGLPARAALEAASQELDAGEWPAPLLAVYLGQMDGPWLLESLRGDAAPARVATAAFYLAQRDLVRGDPHAAAAGFSLARDRGAEGSVERAMLP